MFTRRLHFSFLTMLACAVLAGCERRAWRADPHPPLPEKIKLENIPGGGGAA